MTKVLSNVMLKLYNVMMESLNVRKEIREPSNVTKELSYVMLITWYSTLPTSKSYNPKRGGGGGGTVESPVERIIFEQCYFYLHDIFHNKISQTIDFFFFLQNRNSTLT